MPPAGCDPVLVDTDEQVQPPTTTELTHLSKTDQSKKDPCPLPYPPPAIKNRVRTKEPRSATPKKTTSVTNTPACLSGRKFTRKKEGKYEKGRIFRSFLDIICVEPFHLVVMKVEDWAVETSPRNIQRKGLATWYGCWSFTVNSCAEI